MSQAIVGTWSFLKYMDGRESRLPGTYTFNADGSGSFDLPDGLSLPMRWKILGSRLRFGGASQSTVDLHFPDDDTLVLTDNNGMAVAYGRVKK
jgi:hypothetical protein